MKKRSCDCFGGVTQLSHLSRWGSGCVFKCEDDGTICAVEMFGAKEYIREKNDNKNLESAQRVQCLYTEPKIELLSDDMGF